MAFVEYFIAHHDTADVGDVFTLCHITVNAEAVDDHIAAELINNHGGLCEKARAVFRCPPVFEIAFFIVLAALVIETMCDLVPESRTTNDGIKNGIVGQYTLITRNNDIIPGTTISLLEGL